VAVPALSLSAGGWRRWVPYAGVVWSSIYGVLGIYWAVGGSGFPYASGSAVNPLGPLLGRLGPAATWTVIVLAGMPAAALGVAMLRNVRGRVLRPLLAACGLLLAGALLLLMTGFDLLVSFGYIPYFVRSLFYGAEFSQVYLEGVAAWGFLHQLLCLTGGFSWLAATFIYIRRSGEACLYCGRHDRPEGWQSPDQAARWGRTAVYISLVAPVVYALTRYAWALGIPLGMSGEYLRRGQETGTWTSGLFLANFGLVGAVLSLGLVQKWGEIFPRWMPGLGGRRVPITLAILPASLAAVLLVGGGIGIWAGLPQMAGNAAAAGAEGLSLFWELTVQVGPTLLFPVWGLALAVGALGYYYRRRGLCRVCGRGAQAAE
jgi:hypothetical protein